MAATKATLLNNHCQRKKVKGEYIMVKEKYWEGTNQIDRWWANYVLEGHGWNGGWCSSKKQLEPHIVLLLKCQTFHQVWFR